MATFQAQVEGLTQLTMGSGDAPSTTELTQFLKDGVLDTTGKWLIGHPQDRELFMDETDLQVAQGANIDGADIISVVRADGVAAGNFRACKRIAQGQQSVVTDIESLFYTSKYNPAYMLNSDNSVAVFPAPSDNSGKDSYKIYYVNNAPRDGDGNPLTHEDSALRSFPANKVYLVVLYASIQTLQAAMSSNLISLNISTPTVPVISSVAFTSVDSSLDASAPTFLTTSLSAANVYSGNAPTFVPPSLSQVTTYIETNQDTELASAKLQEVNANMQNALNTFNTENIAYQSAIQESMQEMQAANQTHLSKAQSDLQLALSNKDRDLQRQLQNGINDMQAIISDNQAKVTQYQAEVADYQAEVAKEVQENTTKTQQYQGLYLQLLQQYNSAFQVTQGQQQPQGGR